MTQHKVAVVMGTRPEAIKLAPVVRELELRRDVFETVLITASQHREMLDQVVPALRLRPHVDLDLMHSDQALGEYAARALNELTTRFQALRPELVLVQGDTSTAAMAALAAAYLGCRIGHVEAGLRSFDPLQPFPEEMNRRVISTVSDLHFAPTARARENLLREGHPDDSIFVTGNTVVDAMALIDLSGDWDDPRLSQVDFSGSRVILATAHRRESHGQGLEQICEALRRLAAMEGVSIVYPVHLNPRVQEVVQRTLRDLPDVHLVSPLSYPDLLRTLDRCTLVLTDSGGIQEEAPSFRKPVLVLRDVTERPEILECGAGVLVGTDADRIVTEAVRLLEDSREYERRTAVDNPFGDGKAAVRIADVLAEVLSSG